MSADRIRMPAGALIVAKTTIRRVGSTRAHTPPESLYFCCHVVTLSHFEYYHLKIYLLCAWQQCDNKISLSHCCHAVKHLYINVFPPPWQRDNKKEFFLVWENRVLSYPCFAMRDYRYRKATYLCSCLSIGIAAGDETKEVIVHSSFQYSKSKGKRTRKTGA